MPASTLVPLLQVTGSMQRLETPTEFRLPYNNQNIEHEYCQYPPVKLSTSDALELTEDEIVEKLMDFHLAYFNTALAPENCRIAGYKIDQIYYDQRTPNLPLEL